MTETFVRPAPVVQDAIDGTDVYVLGRLWYPTVDGLILGQDWWRPTTAPSIATRMATFKVVGQQLLVQKTFTAASPGYTQVLYDTPIPALAGELFVSAVLTNRYVYTSPGGFSFTSSPDALLVAPVQLSGATCNGRFILTTAGVANPPYPTQVSGSQTDYYPGPIFEPTATVDFEPVVFDFAPQILVPAESSFVPQFTIGGLTPKWRFEMLTHRVSRANRSKVQVSVSADANGLPYDPRGNAVSMAFLQSGTARPEVADWKAATWDVTRIGTFVAQCNVGPGGTTDPSPGRYYAWLKIDASVATGEVPVEQIGILIVE